jgi:bacteriocin-like protein
MTYETRELNINELDTVSGGFNFSATVLTNIAANERFTEWQGRESNSTRQPLADVISSSS